MANRSRLSDKEVKNQAVPANAYSLLWDTEIPGFALRVTAAGRKAFVFNYRAGGRERRMTIGDYPSWTVAAAREEAKALRRRVARGDDPMVTRHADRAAPTMADLCALYAEEHKPKKRPSTRAEYQSMLDRTIRPKLGKMKVADIRFSDVDKLHRGLRKTPYRANRVVAVLSNMFNFAIRKEWISQNPAKGIERFQEEKRERYLTGEERARLLIAMQEHAAKSSMNRQTVNAFRLAMLTGARIGECLSARWGAFDFDRGLWIKPSSHTKQGKEHRVPLNRPTLQLLIEMRDDAASEWLFPSATTDGPQAGYNNSWAAIRRAAKLPGLRVHDFRHNFASEGASVGLSLPMIGALLGHTNPTTTARYAHLMDDPLREATKRIGQRLTEKQPKRESVQ
jgi:integrase